MLFIFKQITAKVFDLQRYAAGIIVLLINLLRCSNIDATICLYSSYESPAQLLFLDVAWVHRHKALEIVGHSTLFVSGDPNAHPQAILFAKLVETSNFQAIMSSVSHQSQDL